MSASRVLFLVFLGITLVVVAGIGLLPVLAAGENAAEGRSVGLAVLELGWLFMLWGSLIAMMAFLIVWVGESLSEAEATDAAAVEPHAAGMAAETRDQSQGGPIPTNGGQQTAA
jgi:hypothetical protein